MIAENGQLDGTGNPTGLQKVTSSWGATVSRCWIATVGRCDGARARRKVERGKVVVGIPLEATDIPLTAGGMPSRKLRKKLRVSLVLRAQRALIGPIRVQTARKLIEKNCAASAPFMTPSEPTPRVVMQAANSYSSNATRGESLRNQPVWISVVQQLAVLSVVLSVAPQQGSRRVVLRGMDVTVKCRVVPRNNSPRRPHSNSPRNSGRHKIMSGSPTRNNRGSIINNPVVMGRLAIQDSTINNLGSPTSKPTLIYGISTPVQPPGAVSESLVRPGCARSCAARNSAVLDAWAGRWQCS